MEIIPTIEKMLKSTIEVLEKIDYDLSDWAKAEEIKKNAIIYDPTKDNLRTLASIKEMIKSSQKSKEWQIKKKEALENVLQILKEYEMS